MRSGYAPRPGSLTAHDGPMLARSLRGRVAISFINGRYHADGVWPIRSGVTVTFFCLSAMREQAGAEGSLQPERGTEGHPQDGPSY